MYFRMFRDSKDEWRWQLRAANNETIAVSSEGYVNRADCRHAIDLVKSSADAPVLEAS